MKYIQRVEELKFLEEAASSDKSEFLYVRGRRRVGKSWLLEEFKRKKGDCLLFSGAADSTAINTMKTFIENWVDFSGDRNLANYKLSFLSWRKVFQVIGRFVFENQKSLTIIIDEIQWVAKEGSGFVGALKEAWVLWQKQGFIKVILCGSSNKFFVFKTGGEEKILRGLQTCANLWVEPFTPFQVKENYFPSWKTEEVALLYMMTGGMPYYLERVNYEKEFIHAVNDAFFTKMRNLLNEVDEILNLDFNVTGQETAKIILSALGQDGCDQKNIVKKTGHPKGSVSRVIDKLVDYEIVFKKFPVNKTPAKNQEGIKYYMKDFFLNFYFQILAPLSHKIVSNGSGLIFPYDTKLSQEGYYIPNFTGKAFELFIRYLLENRVREAKSFFDLLLLKDNNYSVHDYWDDNSQIDLIVEHKVDRIYRIIECKWGRWDKKWIEEIKRKKIQLPETCSEKYFLVTSAKVSESVIKKAGENKVTVITLHQIFGN